MSNTQANEAVSINIRAKVRQRDLIDQAADRQGRSRSDFMLDAACREAQNVLLDQAFITVDGETFAKFQQLIDAPLPPTDKLRRLLKTPAPALGKVSQGMLGCAQLSIGENGYPDQRAHSRSDDDHQQPNRHW